MNHQTTDVDVFGALPPTTGNRFALTGVTWDYSEALRLMGDQYPVSEARATAPAAHTNASLFSDNVSTMDGWAAVFHMTLHLL